MLAARHVYNNVLWSYGVKHNDVAAIRQFLQFADGFVSQCGDWLDSPLLSIDPIVRKSYEQMDYVRWSTPAWANWAATARFSTTAFWPSTSTC